MNGKKNTGRILKTESKHNMGRRKIVAGNWKMNLTNLEAVRLADQICLGIKEDFCDVILFPSFLYLHDVLNMRDNRFIKVGAQNCSAHENGAYTGEVSALQLSSAGVSHVIIGHSERRENFGESNELLIAKLKIALKYELKPIFCCGEPLAVRNQNNQLDYVLKQLHESLFGFSDEEVLNITLAYEPIWAIGTGLNATPAQAQEIHSFIRSQLRSAYSDDVAANIRILYGGSCKPDNAAELFGCPDVDGGLIGGASLKAADFLSIIQAAK